MIVSNAWRFDPDAGPLAQASENPSSPAARDFLRAKPAVAHRGILVAIEGLDGSGKTTVANHVRELLRGRGHEVVVSNWNEAVELYNLMMRLNAAGDLTPKMRAIFGAADLAVRLQYVIEPALHAGHVVLATKYLLPRFAHARIRDVGDEFLTRLFDFAPEPALTVWLEVSPHVALDRKRREGRIGFWEAGLDLALGLPLHEALEQYARGSVDDDAVEREFALFQQRLHDTYQSDLSRLGSVLRLNGTLPVEVIGERTADRIEQLLRASSDS